MSQQTMRAKVRVSGVSQYKDGEGRLTGETLAFTAVAASSYPADGSDENNTYAKYTPSAEFKMHVANPNLFGVHQHNDEFYVDFIRVPKKE